MADQRVAKRLTALRAVVLTAQKINPDAVQTSMLVRPDGALLPRYKIGNASETDDPEQAARLAARYLKERPVKDLSAKPGRRISFDPMDGDFGDLLKSIFG